MQTLDVKNSAADVTGVSANSPSGGIGGGFESLVQTAQLEFFPAVQLLVDRVALLTKAAGAAVAIECNNRYVYCACSGASKAEIGAPADMSAPMVVKCLATKSPAASSGDAVPEKLARVVAPVLRSNMVVGFLELTADRQSFSIDDLAEVERFAKLITTVLDLRDGAENAECRILDPTGSQQPAQDEKSPSLLQEQAATIWQAPVKEDEGEPQAESVANSPAPARSCQSCGFPVSEGRTLCVDCEQNPHRSPVQAPLLQLNQEEESWLSRHGFTLASLVISALVAAIIYWLR